MEFLTEAFRRLDCLNEDVFDASTDLEELSNFSDNDENNTVDIIDIDATTDDDIKTSYIGNIVLECPICKSKIFKSKDDIIIDDESQLANIGEDCPYCYTADGFTIIGKISPYSEQEVTITDKVDDESAEDEHDDEVDDNLNTDKGGDEELKESFDKLHIDLDNTEIDVREKESTSGEEMIAPLEIEDKQDIEDNTDNEELQDDDTADVDFDEFDDEAASGMFESYLQKTYDNVKSYIIENCSMTSDSILLEGKVTFTDGTSSDINFTFRPDSIGADNHVRFLGESKSISRKKNSFILEGLIDKNKLYTKSLAYDYTTRDNGNFVKVKGII